MIRIRRIYSSALPSDREQIEQVKELAVRAGYYCIDTFTPLDRNAFRAARAAVDVALAATRLPLLVVQEGGYSLRNLRRGSVAFFRGMSRALEARDRERVGA